MKAAVLRAYNQPVAIEERPVPRPGAGEVLIKVHACGVCHSDLHLADGDWDLLKQITRLPLVLGHEIAGTVEAVGEGVDRLGVGDRVGVPWLHSTCGTCEPCVAGRENLCLNQQITGCTVDGGYAEYMVARATHAAPLPETLTFEEAAPLLCAGLTVYRALKAAGVGRDQVVAVFGIGGLGHLAVQYARALGARVGAVDVADEKLQLAVECGAAWTANATRAPVHKEIRSAAGGAHVALVTASSAEAYTTAIRSLRRGGTLLVVAMTPQPFTVSPVALVAGEVRILASAVGTRADLDEALGLAVAHQIRSRVERRPLDKAAQALEDLRAGTVVGRIVLVP